MDLDEVFHVLWKRRPGHAPSVWPGTSTSLPNVTHACPCKRTRTGRVVEPGDASTAVLCGRMLKEMRRKVEVFSISRCSVPAQISRVSLHSALVLSSVSSLRFSQFCLSNFSILIFVSTRIFICNTCVVCRNPLLLMSMFTMNDLYRYAFSFSFDVSVCPCFFASLVRIFFDGKYETETQTEDAQP